MSGCGAGEPALGGPGWVGGLDKMTSRGPFQPSDSVTSWVFHCLLLYKILEQFRGDIALNKFTFSAADLLHDKTSCFILFG